MPDLTSRLRDDALKLLKLIAAASLAALLFHAFRAVLPDAQRPTGGTGAGSNPAAISRAELLEQVRRRTTVFVDTRPPSDYAAGHAAGAVNIPAEEASRGYRAVFEWLSPEDDLVLYCETGRCEASARLYAFLLRNGFDRRRIRQFVPGWRGLREMDEVTRP